MATHFDNIEIIFTEANHDLANMWTGFGHESKVLPKGWTKDPGRKPMPIDIMWERDVSIPMRDGTVLYGDVFLPAESKGQKLPAILPWSPFGKTGTGKLSLDLFPWRVGIPQAATSGLEKWEAPDPADWCARGYAVVNVDARGSYHSEGDYYIYGTQEGRDGHDTIEWIASQSWSNGSVGLAGNSWLGTTQWLIAAEQPPHLKAMAPWEGLGDYYRESICRGGIPDHTFWDALFTMSGGQKRREDVSAMVEKYPRWNAYWDDKRPKLANIKVPMYALASYSSGLHTEGSLRGFFLSSSAEKWLRLHMTQEWHDQYQPENLDDLQRFFDRYLKGTENGWEQTPHFQMSLLGYNRPSVQHRAVTAYPPPNFAFTTYHLDAANKQLSPTAVGQESQTSYKAEDVKDPGCHFVHKFDKYTEICGFSRVKLFMSTTEHDDMDVYVVVKKLDKAGVALQHFNIPFADLPPGTTEADIPHETIWRYVGPNGRLRASHRAVMPEPGYPAEALAKLSDGYVWHPHDQEHEQKLTSGVVVELEIGLWATGMIFDPGEAMQLEIKGSLPVEAEFEIIADKYKYYNVGSHVVHSGGRYQSTLQLYVAQ